MVVATSSDSIQMSGDVAPLKRGERIAPQNEHTGYLQCWYPIALSSEVGVGQVVGREFMNGHVVVFRGSEGTPHVMSAFCRHLGANLALGSVIGMSCAAFITIGLTMRTVSA